MPILSKSESPPSNTLYVITLTMNTSAVQEAAPDFKASEISHLRRVAQHKYLPAHLQKLYGPPARLQRGICDDDSYEHDMEPCPTSLFTPLPPSDDESCMDSDDKTNAKSEDTVRIFLLCPTRCFTAAELVTILRRSPPFSTMNINPKLLYVTVPALAPTSAEQASQWSEQYWPIAYKNTNPFGPHPSLVARNTAEIEPEAGAWLGLATRAAAEVSELGVGEKVGCVVVDRSSGVSEVIAVAGDCRWRSPIGETEQHTGPGNVMAHSVQRAIAMVAKKRLRMGGKNPTLLDRSLFCDVPLTAIEKGPYDTDNISASGYLCVELDIYLTHEPCVMCSMAILHSRFKRCIIAERMPLTGGMTADTIGNTANPNKGLQHGIFWRPNDLNWKFLAWECPGKGDSIASVMDTLHV